MVGARLECGCWMVGRMLVVEWRLAVSVPGLGNGCIVVELALRLPRGGAIAQIGAIKAA